MNFAILVIGAYLLGSVPFGLLIAKAHGKDLRVIGSGNIGATNLARAVGRKWAYVCFCLDAAKGLLPMLAAGLMRSAEPTVAELAFTLIAGCAAILGHIFPVYIGFKGGKGVATSFGVALGLWPYFTLCSLISFAVWLVVVLLSRYISLASIIAAVTFPVVLVLGVWLTPSWRFGNLWPLLVGAVAIPVIVVIRHRHNIKRLISGTESKVLQK